MTAGMTAIQIQAEAHRRRRSRTPIQAAHRDALRSLPLPDFAARTKIEVPVGAVDTALVPFVLWEAQRDVLRAMDRERLLVILKARQLGISWLACLYALRLCTLWPGQPVLALSRSQDDANALIHRISVMHREHSDRAQTLPRLVADNTGDLEWDNGSTVTSLAATKNAGRGFTGALVILDEWAFMAWPKETLAAVKPTIDAGGKLWIISSADVLGSEYHSFWQHAQAGSNGYHALFLPWQARPDRDADWRDQKLIESSGDTATVYREYPANDIEAFTHATGLVYDVWADPGNVTASAAFVPGGGDVLWGVDDGYSGALDKATGLYTATSHPRVIGLYQLRHDGTVCRFAESYACGLLSDRHIAEAMVLPHALDDYEKPSNDLSWVSWAEELRERLDCYPLPEYAIVDSSAAELRGRLSDAGVPAFGGTHPVEEGIKVMRRFLAADANGRRRLLVHPDCTHFRAEMASYRRDDSGRLVKAFDHGPDECRMVCYKLRHE